MDCDRVFDLLTRGPVPAGDPETDEAVERHLAACHDCRRLAEALRPAVDLFHEALAADVDDLPCYRGELPVAHETTAVPAVALAERPPGVEVRPASPREAARSRVRSGIAWTIAAAGLAVCLTLTLPFPSRVSPAPATSAEGNDLVLALQLVDGEQQARLESLGLVPRCRPVFRVRGTSESLVQCCAVCHEPSGGRERMRAPVASLTASCIVCHVEPAVGRDVEWPAVATRLRG